MGYGKDRGEGGNRRFFKNSENRPKPRWLCSNLFGFGQIWRLSGRLLSFRSRLVFFCCALIISWPELHKPCFFCLIDACPQKASSSWVGALLLNRICTKNLKKAWWAFVRRMKERKKQTNKEIKQAGRCWLIHNGLPLFPTNYYLVWLKAFANKCLILLCLAVCWFGVFVFCCFGQRCRRRKKKAFSTSCSSCLFVCLFLLMFFSPSPIISLLQHNFVTFALTCVFQGSSSFSSRMFQGFFVVCGLDIVAVAVAAAGGAVTREVVVEENKQHGLAQLWASLKIFWSLSGKVGEEKDWRVEIGKGE